MFAAITAGNRDGGLTTLLKSGANAKALTVQL